MRIIITRSRGHSISQLVNLKALFLDCRSFLFGFWDADTRKQLAPLLPFSHLAGPQNHLWGVSPVTMYWWPVSYISWESVSGVLGGIALQSFGIPEVYTRPVFSRLLDGSNQYRFQVFGSWTWVCVQIPKFKTHMECLEDFESVSTHVERVVTPSRFRYWLTPF